MEKFIVFIRQHNDLDQVLPIIDYLVKEKKSEVKLYSTSRRYLISKLNVNYLTSCLKLKIKSFEIIYNKFERILNKLSYYLINKSYYKIKIIHFIDMLIRNHILFLINYYLSIKINNFIIKNRDYIFLADFGTEDIFPYDYLIHNCKKNNVKILAYNHGMTIFLNENSLSQKKTNYSKKFLNKFNNFIYARYNERRIYPKYTVGIDQKIHFKSNMYGDFNQLGLIKEIGLPRFTYEWNHKFENYFPELKLNKKSNNKKLSICLFLSNQKFNVNVNQLLKLIKEIINLKNVNFSISPHPRSGISGFDKKLFKNIINNSSARHISQNLDIGIVYGTSIAHHLLIKKIPFIVPDFIDSNDNIYTFNKVCFAPKKLEHLVDFINNFSKEQYFSEEMKTNIDNFINYYIYGNRSYKDLMEIYYKEIVS